METTNVTLRLEKGLKEQADELYGTLGLNFTTAVNLFVRKSLSTRSIPFDISVEDEHAQVRALRQALQVLLASAEGSEGGLQSVSAESPYEYPSVLSAEEAKRIVNRESPTDIEEVTMK